MPYLNWNSKYSVNVKCFDEDHQQLFQIINELHDGMKAGHGKDVLQSVLTKLLRYAEEHFAREEAAMKSRGFPQLRAHIEEHRSFTAKMKEVSDQCRAGTIGITVDMLEFLTQWLARHIVGTDQQYSEFLNARGVV
jgi:hemerythrin